MEIHVMTLAEDGFELAFTKPVDPATASDPAAYAFQHYRYKYHRPYGSPQIDIAPAAATAVRISDDRRRIRLVLPALETEKIYELNVTGIRAGDGTELLHPTAYYTLNRR